MYVSGKRPRGPENLPPALVPSLPKTYMSLRSRVRRSSFLPVALSPRRRKA